MVDERNGHGGNLKELPRGWVWTRLENCVEILDGKRVPINADEREKRNAGKRESELFPYYGATGKVGWIDDFLFDEELLLLGEDGAPFLEPTKHKAYIINGRTWVNNHAHVLRARYGLTLNTLLCHYLNAFDYHEYVTGTTRLKLPQAPLRKIPIPLAPLHEQRRIVTKIEELFSDLDAGVVALQKVKAQLKRYRQAVLKAAVEGKLTAEWRVVNAGKIEPASALLERTRAERAKNANGKAKPLSPTGMAGLGELPEGWCWTTFAEIISEFRSGSTVVPQNEATEFPILRSSSIRSQKIDYADTRYLQEEGSRNPANFLKVGNLLFVRLSGSVEYVGDCALVRKAEASKIQYPDRIFCATLVDHRLGSYLEMWFASPSARKQTMALIKSTAGHKRISMDAIEQRNIPIPSVAELEVIVAEVERRLSVTDEVEKTVDQSLKQAERLRQSILKRAFAGKLVPQDPSDEPAQKLLERIRVAREKGHAPGVPQRGAPQRKHARKM